MSSKLQLWRWEIELLLEWKQPVHLDVDAMISCPIAGCISACHMPSVWSRTTEMISVKILWLWKLVVGKKAAFFKYWLNYVIIVWNYGGKDTTVVVVFFFEPGKKGIELPEARWSKSYVFYCCLCWTGLCWLCVSQAYPISSWACFNFTDVFVPHLTIPRCLIA